MSMIERPFEDTINCGERVMVMGPPNSGKTQSLLSWPYSEEEQLFIVSLPGEKGHETIPRNRKGVRTFIQRYDPEEQRSSGAIIRDLETTVFEIIGGKYGPVKTLALDGTHKHYDFILDDVTGGAFFAGHKTVDTPEVKSGKGGDEHHWFAPQLYSQAHSQFKYFVDRVNASAVQFIAWTCWDGQEADDPKARRSPTHIYPRLPGKMAKDIMGEFSIVIYSQLELYLAKQGKPARATWQILPEGEIWGAAVKAPLEVILRLPKVLPEQSFPLLQETLRKAWSGEGPVLEEHPPLPESREPVNLGGKRKSA